jgi:hypothetical protein
MIKMAIFPHFPPFYLDQQPGINLIGKKYDDDDGLDVYFSF